MSFDNAEFNQLTSDRLAYIDGLRRNKGFEAGIRRLLTELYPDNAHFIYELLQNAEDAKASHARFKLNKDSLVFEHDGPRLFSARDVESITSIGDSTKADSPTEIGKFGVGFKAVFAYTETPEVYSGEYQFRIRDLVVPELLSSSVIGAEGFKTRFVFPFNHPNKSGQQAVLEIAAALKALDDATLLFLSNIARISYFLPDDSEGYLERIVASDRQQGGSKGEHIEVSMLSPEGEVCQSNWLRYRTDVQVNDGLEHKDCTVAVAFGLEGIEGRNKQLVWRLVPLTPGRVCIYFPAEKETSNLRFHMHAPFASTVARDSVRDSPGNDQLLAALANLAAESMEDIRDRGMLTVAALEALPIKDDNLSPFYTPVRERILEAFKSRHLVPTKSGTHRMAENLIRGPSDIVNLISDEDLATLTEGKYEIPLWCANPPQINQRADKFLDALKIDRWDWEQLCDVLNCSESYLTYEDPIRIGRLNDWLASKDDMWIQRFYALLHDETKPHYDSCDVSGLAFVRVGAGSGARMVKPSEAFFPPPDDSLVPNDVFLVKPATYTSGKSDSQKSAARHFLEKAGVRVYDEEVKLTGILDLYRGDTFPDQRAHLEHMKRFVAFYRTSPHKKQSFLRKYIFRGHKAGSETDLLWCSADKLYLDLPFEETGLTAIEDTIGKLMLWSGYEKLSARKAFVEFVRELGIQADLPIDRVTTYDNPACDKLRVDYQGYRVKKTSSAIDVDWTIKNIEKLVMVPTIGSSRLLWETLTKAAPEVAKAKFRPNQQYPLREADSDLICYLKATQWIPDTNGEFHKPQDISRDQLYPGFNFDDRNGLLSAIGFEASIRTKSEEHQRKDKFLREIGFVGGVEGVKNLAKVCHDLGIDEDTAADVIKQSLARPEPPEVEVRNPSRRREGVMEHRENAPDNSAVRRERSVQPNLSEVLAKAKAYLRIKYTNKSRQLVCQLCEKEMPFKLPTADYYFEAVQVIKGLAKHFYENRLALCPTCAAMYQFARTDTDEDVRSAIIAIDTSEKVEGRVALPLILAGEKRILHFVGPHFLDLQTVIDDEGSTI